MKNALPTIPGRRAALATLSREERNFARQWGDVPAIELKTARKPLSHYIPRVSIEGVLIGGLLAVAFASGMAAFNMSQDSAPAARLIATTFDGNVYEVGDGDTCKEVYDRDPVPADWRLLECSPADWRLLECSTANGDWNEIARRTR